MKKVILSIISVFLFSVVFAGNDPYFDAMNETLKAIDSAKTKDDFQQIANKFERIANAEKDKWQPYYYAAFSYIMMSYREKDKDMIEKYTDLAQELITKGILIDSVEPELFILDGMADQAKIMVNPMKRGQKYSMKANEKFDKAKALDPENPRMYYLIGMNTFHTPKMFGGGKDNALPLFNTAKEKFDKFVPKLEINPNWGKSENEEMIKQCAK